jgi:hypothetical protein
MNQIIPLSSLKTRSLFSLVPATATDVLIFRVIKHRCLAGLVDVAPVNTPRSFIHSIKSSRLVYPVTDDRWPATVAAQAVATKPAT